VKPGSEGGKQAQFPSAFAVEASDLCKIVPDPTGSLTILDHINLGVSAGQTLAIRGASGSGKSTLLGLLAGLDVPTSGTVRLFDQDLTSLDEDGRARLRASRVGFVFQSFQLLEHLTALENVMLPLEIGAEPMGRSPRSRALELLERVGLADRTGHEARTLSGGEQQRVALARAFVTRPAILFADEPTGSLDSATGARVIDLMFELNREFGSTLVVVTHDPEVASRCARRVELRAGRIEAHTGEAAHPSGSARHL
jgi:putative ABC transport system ATP-binding protein